MAKKQTFLNRASDSDAFYKQLWDTVASKKVWEGEIANKKKNGDIYWEHATVSPILNRQDEIVNFMKVSQEVTAQVEIKEQLQNDKQKAEEADKQKSAFLANMSHEIRTPMNAIVGFGQLLEDPNLNEEERKEFIDTINSQGEYLLSLINDIIDISKIEAGVITLREEVCDLQDLMHDLYVFFKLNRTNNIDIRALHDQLTFGSEIYTDATRLRQILTNLISNAVKFTEKGYVEFGVELSGDQQKLQFYVKDTGIGIGQESLNRVFDRFYQVMHRNKEVAYKGTGLGLSISKAFVELMGGDIWVSSEEFVGTTFYFTIPYQPVEKEKQRVKVEKNEYSNIFYGHKILIVEDIESNYQFLRHALEPTGAETIWAKNGKEAIDHFKKDSSIALVLMDINMPVLDGYDATKKIRQLNQTVPIIAQTANAMEGDRKKTLRAGCTDYIAKPVKIPNLINIINNYLGVKA
ncbi:MAG: response regulator [Bacteroidales bacterium]|nr:response regulator [Bacteroidales bacterium]